VEKLGPMSKRLTELKEDPAELDAILLRGAEKARAIAEPTLAAAYQAMGL
jgi:tryptophanyl-tRNA synthetase